MNYKLYSNEIVFRGHPDKVCDQISAAILDNCLLQDPKSRVGVEVVGGKGKMFITGEITTNAIIDVKKIAKSVLRDVGYSDKMLIIDNIGKQSSDINQGVDKANNYIGAGDQGMMFGYATNETKYYLPKAMVILQELAIWYDVLRKEDSRYKPDGKAQITGWYDEKNRLLSIQTFTISYQNKNGDPAIIKNEAIKIAKKYGVEIETFLINPTGKFEIGGFDGDAGLTGRKIVVDAYQSFANVGGGCMNGKDPTKVDISAALKAREIAKEMLTVHKLSWCEVQLSYAIGIAHPLAIYIRSNIGNINPTKELYERCKVGNIINDLKLLEPLYEFRARHGHFGVYTGI